MKELYHATAPTRLGDILDRGLTDKGESKFQGNVGQRGVSTTHDFSVVSGGNFGNLVLVLDGAKLSNYELVPTDYWGDDSEKEIRVVSKQEGETIIPPEAIKKLVFISPEMRRFEIKHLRQHGIPIESFWKGETTTYGEDGRAIKENKMNLLETLTDEQLSEIVSEVVTSLYEKKDACYHKVKSRYKVFPSAYASGALVQCRKVGAKNWGNSKKNELRDVVRETVLAYLQEADFELEKERGLKGWFDRQGASGSEGGWVDCKTCRKDKKTGRKKCSACAQGDRKEKPYCRPKPSDCGKK